MIRIDDLQYKGLKIYQDTEEFCFGTDAVLLANFVRAKRGERAVDLCSGTGIIALLVCARCDCSVTAVELQSQMAQLCNRSVELNSLQDRITVRCADLKTVGFGAEAGSADVVTCNPPYKSPDGSLASEKESIRIARQEIACDLEDVISASARLLRFGGRLFMVHQSQRIMDIIAHMRNYAIEPKRIRLIQPKADKGANLVLIEAMRGGKPGVIWEPTLVLQDANGQYTDELKSIYHIQ